MQKCLVEFGIFGEWVLVIVGLAVALGKLDYVVGSVGGVSHKDASPFRDGLFLTSVGELPCVPQTAKSL